MADGGVADVVVAGAGAGSWRRSISPHPVISEGIGQAAREMRR